MDTTRNKALICSFIDEYQTGADERALRRTVHPDVVDHSRPPGRIIEHWNCVDRLGLMMQLGALPAPSAVGG
jgi:hypothetical protein